MEKLTNDIYEAIKQNLSGQVSDTLQRVLAEYKSLKEEIENYKSNIENLKTQYYNLDISHNELLVLKNTKTELDKREKELVIRENKIELVEKDKKCSEEKVGLIKECFNIVFRNTEIRRNKMGNIPLINKCPDGSEYATTIPTDIIETEKKE